MAPPHQRQNPRIRIQIPVFLRGTDALGVDFIELTKTLNISSTGACIASSHILQTEQVIQLTIPTPSPSTAGLVPYETPPISACSTALALHSHRPIPRGDKEVKVHTGDSQLRRSGIRAHASE